MGARKRRINKVAENSTVIALGETLDITVLSALRERLLDALALNEPVCLDATSTQTVDTAGLQMLCSFVRSADEQGTTITWTGQTSLIAERARLLGLGDLLGLPMDTGKRALQHKSTEYRSTHKE